MSVVAQCGACRKRFRAPAHLAGKRAKCKCGAIVAIPEPEAATTPAGAALVEAFAQNEAPSDGVCPGCGGAFDAAAVICTACGFNRQTGTRMSVRVSVESDDDAPAPRRKQKKDKPQKTGDSDSGERLVAIAGPILKVVFVVGALGGIGWIGYNLVTAASFSPGQQAAEIEKQILIGMKVDEVVELVGRPPRETHVWQDEDAGLGFGAIDVRIPFKDNFMEAYDEETLKYGFYFIFRFSERDLLHVYFTPKGEVDRTEIVDPMEALGL